MSTTYIAYRFPFQTKCFYQKGIAKQITATKEIDEEGIIFHSFSGDHILFIANPENISPSTVELSFSTPEDIDQTEDAYRNSFRKLKEAIAKEQFQKVILSRTKSIPTSKDALEIFDALNRAYTNTFNYVISNPEIGTWIGATPERLLSIDGMQLTTMALAGTKTPEVEWTTKEFEEQQLVTDTILSVLKQHCSTVQSSAPETINAGKIQHLKTSITAELQSKTDWHNIVDALHPTPAVCGIPTVEAKRYIPKLEAHQRKFYTGFIGLITNNQKDFFVNLRCMELYKNLAKLYLGGGITAPSEEQAEWLETERKATTLANVLK